MTAGHETWRVDAENVRALLEGRLLAEMGPSGAWEGELSSSALAGAVAAIALHLADPEAHADAIESGLRWLREAVNDDGGWGDSPCSRSNLATTVLVWSAFHLTRGRDVCPAERRAAARIREMVGHPGPRALAEAIAAGYGDDRTFSAPILTLAALCGTLGAWPAAWSLVPQLPFEAAILPRRLLSLLRLPVVSYALPALVAVGLARHRHLASRNPLLRLLRDRATNRALERLARLQPGNGGFLEATPLTAFVTACLAACGLGRHPVVERSVAFLRASQRQDGSWPIDTHLATWLTCMAVKALDAGGGALPPGRRQRTLGWLLGQQVLARHPYTGAAPGGFAWTDLPGGVPDADDTSGALLALRILDPTAEATRQAACQAVKWLLALQNGDGGVPTFCRGWGRLPFDRSCPDITAHAVRAVVAWRPALAGRAARGANRFVSRGLRYLANVQRPDGSWLPLWFGNQWQSEGRNAVYGTAQVLVALRGINGLGSETAAGIRLGTDWLVRAQNPDGGWGRAANGSSTIEETGLALAALADHVPEGVLARGTRWLTRRTAVASLPAAPIGLYFSSLWYSERLYPLVFAVLGLGRVLGASRRPGIEPAGWLA
jgi:squalene-hopene/tetraprenyl-beta-curcumene cyclase